MTAPTICSAAENGGVVDLRRFPNNIFRYIASTTWPHQLALLSITVAVFLLEIVPLEIQRRVVNDVIKRRPFEAVVALCGAYVAVVLVQGSAKLGLNIYRAWVSERATRDLRGLVSRSTPRSAAALADAAEQGTAVTMTVAEVEPVGNFVGVSFSEPVLQVGILATVISYVIHVDPWLGVTVLLLLVPQFAFVPLMQHGMNRRTKARVWLLRQIGAGMIGSAPVGRSADQSDMAARIDSVFGLNMGIFELKFSMNFLMNLCTHLQIVAALLLGGWWVMQGRLEAGAIVALISAVGRLTDPWGDLVNYFRELSGTRVKFALIADAIAKRRIASGAGT